MKKIFLILLAVVVVLLVGMPWFLGAQLEKRLPSVIAQGAQEAERYGLALHLRNYQRGYLTSTAQMLLLYQPPGEQIPLYQGNITLNIRHAPLLASGFNFMMARLQSDDDAQGVLAQALPAGFLEANAGVGLGGRLHINGRLMETRTNLLPRPNRPQHLAFHGARFQIESTLAGYPERGKGHLELHGVTFTDGDQRWHIAPLRIDFTSEDVYEAQAQLPELILQHSLHALSAREQIRIGGFTARMQQGLSPEGKPYPHKLDYHITDFKWIREQHGETYTRHLRDLSLNAALRRNDGAPSVALNMHGQVLQLDLAGSWQDIAPENFSGSVELQPFDIKEALALLDALRHPLPDTQHVPLPDKLRHLQLPAGASHVVHYLAAHMARQDVRLRWQMYLQRQGETLVSVEGNWQEHMNAANSMELLKEFVSALDHTARLPTFLKGSRIHIVASTPFMQKSGLGIALLFAGFRQYLDDAGQFKLDAVVDEGKITVNEKLLPLTP